MEKTPSYSFQKHRYQKRKVTYSNIVCKLKLEKEEKEGTRLTVGVNLMDFTGNLSIPTASVTTEKCKLNGVVSTPGAKFLLDDIKKNLNNISPYPEFMHIPLKIIRQEIVDGYNLDTLVNNQGWIYMHMDKGMYGLKQAGIIDNQELVKHMDPFGYHPVHHTPGLWVHDNQKIFSHVDDDFCVQYYSVKDADHFQMHSNQNI